MSYIEEISTLGRDANPVFRAFRGLKLLIPARITGQNQPILSAELDEQQPPDTRLSKPARR